MILRHRDESQDHDAIPRRLLGRLSKSEERFKFRNDVIHAGYFPSQQQVLDFARWVYELIVETRATLIALDANAVDKVELRHYRLGHVAVLAKAGEPKKGKDGMYRSASSAALPMMLNTMVKGAPEDFDTRLAAAKENLGLWGFPKVASK